MFVKKKKHYLAKNAKAEASLLELLNTKMPAAT